MKTKLSKEDIANREKEFQILQTKYFENQDKSSWDSMWFYVRDACSNSAKSQLSVKTDDLEGKVLNATCDVMNKIKSGVRINKLSSFVYLYVKGRLFNVKVKRAEQTLSYDYYISSTWKKEEYENNNYYY